MLQEHILEKKACHDSTKCIEQKSISDRVPKRHRRYDGTHVNIASFINSSGTEEKQSML